ncbi:MAG: hypothetical protein ACW98Y_04890 [Candidatus Thorarchaeota archaeon]|jgi:hypothetical protein
MRKPSLKHIAYTFLIVLLILTITPKSAEAIDEEVNESYFDVRVTLRFEDGEFVKPNSSFTIEFSGSWVDVGLQVEIVQARGTFVEFVYLKVNGEGLLFSTGSIRVHTSEFGSNLEIEAYGEAFVSYTDSYYKDSVIGQLTANQDQLIPYTLLGISGLVIVVAALSIIVVVRRDRPSR